MNSCNQCDYKTINPGDLKKHLMFHSKTKNFACSTCEAKFTTSSDLHRHMKTHESLKSFICSFESCGFSTLRREHLVNHESTHTSIESRLRHPCNECNKCYSSQSVLNRHKKTCNKPKVKPASKPEITECQVCKKKVSNIYKLKDHMKLHEDILEFVCDVCGKSFATIESLNKHSVLHAPKKFACEICDKVFSRRDYLAKHIKSHTNARITLEYVCINCEEGFDSSRALEIHSEECLDNRPQSAEELIFIPNYSQEVVIAQVEEMQEDQAISQAQGEEQVYYLIL